jgi:hypothetical protein
LDETGFVKKGMHSVGVQRQYSGTAGRIENCQVGVFLAYASPKGHALLDRALYLPERWAGDAGRRAKAGVPAEVAFATKPKLGLTMLQRALAAGVPFAWVTGDSVYGSDHRLRRLIERHGRGYVLAVTGAQRLGLKPVEDWLEDVPARGWRRLSAGEGAKGPSAGSGELMCERREERAAVVVAEALLEFVAGELAVRFGHGPLAVRPPGLDRVEPGALAGQTADQEATAAAALGPAVVVPDPGANRAADVPGSVVPDQGQDPDAFTGEPLGDPGEEGAGHPADRPAGGEAQQHPPRLRQPHAVAGERLCVGVVAVGPMHGQA